MDIRPNFVIFIPDQLRADALGAFGNPHIRTPNLDALAARGTRFTNAYVQHPVCVPSRASFLTGWYPHTSGHRSQNHLLRPHEPNLLRILKDAGYHVTWAGRRGDTFAPGVTETSVHEYGYTEPPPASAYRPELATWPGGDLWARLFYFGRTAGNLDQDEATIRTAEQRLAAIPDAPWTLFVPIIAPHCPFRAPEPWFSMYDRDTMPDPIPPGEIEPRYVPALRNLHRLERVAPEIWREVIATYYAMVSRMDDHLGRVLSAVERTGQAGNTVTMFFADHGEYLGDFGLIEKWPSAMHPCITRDPLVIAGGGLPEGQVYDGMVELVDVLPTVLELAGVPAPHRHFGRSLLTVLHDPGSEHREYAFTEGGFTVEEESQLEDSPFPYDLKTALQHHQPDLVGKATAIRDREWTYVWRLYDPPELYHRVTDPDERHNIAGRSEHSEVERRLSQALLRWLMTTTDIIPTDSDPRMPDVDLPTPQPVSP
ncbi:sulfatase [Parafrankia sp. EAN1pec]|uniref:sulfatase-like hydrolase/transferase n=1 Tax=Parafrankia sp. (strain EAN1pec) TaxID=298653 RepID=UPI0000543C47|nr:sulfatase [Frankia sp. EAN1pec]